MLLIRCREVRLRVYSLSLAVGIYYSAASYVNALLRYHPEESFVGEVDVLFDGGQDAEDEADQHRQETTRKQTIITLS